MSWNPLHENSDKFSEKDLQEAYDNFREKYAWYDQKVERRMKIFELDLQDIQKAFNRFLKLKKHYGHHSRLPDQRPGEDKGSN